MKLSKFLEQENISLSSSIINIKTFESYTSECFKLDINETQVNVSYIDCEIRDCYDRSFNKKKCLCITLDMELEYVWDSFKELRELLNSKGYEFYIKDMYVIHGCLPNMKVLDINEIKEYVKLLEEDWYLFIQIDDKLIVLIDDPNDTTTGYFMHNDYTCYIFNVNQNALIKREQEILERYILEKVKEC